MRARRVTVRLGSSRIVWTIAVVAATCGSSLAVQPIPLAAGTYCGPGDARIVVDVANDRVTIDRWVCSYPVIAADHLQSDLCSGAEGDGVKRNFDFSVVGLDFFHAGAWYRRCGDVPATGG